MLITLEDLCFLYVCLPVTSKRVARFGNVRGLSRFLMLYNHSWSDVSTPCRPEDNIRQYQEWGDDINPKLIIWHCQKKKVRASTQHFMLLSKSSFQKLLAFGKSIYTWENTPRRNLLLVISIKAKLRNNTWFQWSEVTKRSMTMNSEWRFVSEASQETQSSHTHTLTHIHGSKHFRGGWARRRCASVFLLNSLQFSQACRVRWIGARCRGNQCGSILWCRGRGGEGWREGETWGVHQQHTFSFCRHPLPHTLNMHRKSCSAKEKRFTGRRKVFTHTHTHYR